MPASVSAKLLPGRTCSVTSGASRALTTRTRGGALAIAAASLLTSACWRQRGNVPAVNPPPTKTTPSATKTASRGQRRRGTGGGDVARRVRSVFVVGMTTDIGSFTDANLCQILSEGQPPLLRPQRVAAV